MIAVTKKLDDSFTVRLEAKNSSSGPAYFFLEYRQKKVVRSSLFPRIDIKNIDREVQPKRSSFSGKMEVAKPFLCSKLSRLVRMNLIYRSSLAFSWKKH